MEYKSNKTMFRIEFLAPDGELSVFPVKFDTENSAEMFAGELLKRNDIMAIRIKKITINTTNWKTK